MFFADIKFKKAAPKYGINNTKYNGQVAAWKFAITIDKIINSTPYLFLFVSINFSIAYISIIKHTKDTICDLAV